eukprot:1598519-Amphidinium_carterae.1
MHLGLKTLLGEPLESTKAGSGKGGQPCKVCESRFKNRLPSSVTEGLLLLGRYLPTSSRTLNKFVETSLDPTAHDIDMLKCRPRLRCLVALFYFFINWLFSWCLPQSDVAFKTKPLLGRQKWNGHRKERSHKILSQKETGTRCNLCGLIASSTVCPRSPSECIAFNFLLLGKRG